MINIIICFHNDVESIFDRWKFEEEKHFMNITLKSEIQDYVINYYFNKCITS